MYQDVGLSWKRNSASQARNGLICCQSFCTNKKERKEKIKGLNCLLNCYAALQYGGWL